MKKSILIILMFTVIIVAQDSFKLSQREFLDNPNGKKFARGDYLIILGNNNLLSSLQSSGGDFIEFNPFDDFSVPSEPGVYVLYGPTDSVLYVGKSNNARTRIRTHREKKWFVEPIVNSGMFFLAESDDERDKLERILIKFLRSNAWLNKVGRYRK